MTREEIDATLSDARHRLRIVELKLAECTSESARHNYLERASRIVYEILKYETEVPR